MDAADRVTQWRQVCVHYRSLTDDELIAIARQKEDLTDIAQQALAAEVQSRKLEVPAEATIEDKETAPLALPPDPDSNSPYYDDRELVQIETVFSLRDAEQLEALLKEDGIPFYMGKEKVTRAVDVRSDFSAGIPVGVMRIGMAYATRARKNFRPLDDPEWREEKSPLRPVDIFCPRCRSEKVVFEAGQQDPKWRDFTMQFRWRCEACGKRWEDDGVIEEL